MQTNTSVITNLLISLLALCMLVAGSPTLRARDVFVPPITYPRAGTVWKVKDQHTVTWDTSHAPVNITNKVGSIRLRQNGATLPVILADGFDILLGKIEVQVPWVVAGDYELVLFGDSGNFSPTFSITA